MAQIYSLGLYMRYMIRIELGHVLHTSKQGYQPGRSYG